MTYIDDSGPSKPGLDGSVVECLVYIQEVLGSIPSLVIFLSLYLYQVICGNEIVVNLGQSLSVTEQGIITDHTFEVDSRTCLIWENKFPFVFNWLARHLIKDLCKAGVHGLDT